jgi:hypothetical protein
MVVSRHQNVGQNHNLLIGDKMFENVAKFNYLRKQYKIKFFHEEIMRRLNTGNSSYHSVQSLMSSQLLSKT